jgi:methyl-accepting chemotaxis protein
MLMFKKKMKTKMDKGTKPAPSKGKKFSWSKITNMFIGESIAKKLLLSTLVSMGGFIFIGAIGILSMYSITGQMEKMYNQNVTGIELAADIERSIHSISETALNFTAETDEKAKPVLRQEIFQGQQSFKNAIADYYAKVAKTTEEQEVVSQLSVDYDIYDKAIQNLITAFSQERAMEVYNEQVLPAQERIIETISQLVEYKSQSAQNMYEGSRMVFTSVVVFYTVIVGTIILVSFFLSIMLSQRITGTLKQVNDTVSRVAAGDLTVPELKVTSRDEIGQLAASFNTMTAELRELVEDIIKGADNLASSTQQMSASTEQGSLAIREIADAAQQLAVGADEQSRKIEEAMSYVEESSAAIEEISATTQEVAAATQQVSEKANKGNEAMGQAKDEMEKINNSTAEIAGIINELVNQSHTISNIVGLISGIADQTNLLALNAAIEAARAGEQGRGFAVVAEEVRKLADQSQEAAKDIANLIKRMQEGSSKAVETMDKNKIVVENGSLVILQGAEAFAEISTAVSEVLRQVKEVSRSTEELAKSGEEIVKVMEAIDVVTKEVTEASHQVAATTEEQSAAFEQLSNSSQFLSKLGSDLQVHTGKFTI